MHPSVIAVTLICAAMSIVLSFRQIRLNLVFLIGVWIKAVNIKAVQFVAQGSAATQGL